MIKVINHNQTKLFEQAGAELVQAQDKFQLLMKFKLTLQLVFTTSPGGWVGAGCLILRK